MIKRTISLMLAALLLTAATVFPVSAAGGSYSEAMRIWPINSNLGYWYTNEYSYDSTAQYNLLDTKSEKYLDYTLKNGVWTASISNFAPGKIARSNFVFVNGGCVVDLRKDPYLYYDFTMQDVMWKLTIRVGIENGYTWDVDIPLQKIICKQEEKANLIDNTQYGVRGVYQGRINLNEAIEQSGNNNFYDNDLKNKRIRIVSGYLEYFQCYQKDVMQLRYIGVGHGERDFAAQTEELEMIHDDYKASDVAVKGQFKEGREVFDCLDKTLDWKTNISDKEMGAVGSDTAYLDMNTEDGFVIKATGQSVKDKTYIKGAIIGWPQITASIPAPTTFFVDNTYLVYDIKAETGWDIFLNFNTHFRVSLLGVINSITSSNTIENLSAANGTRGFGLPGHYKGVLDLEEILNYYTINLNQRVVSCKQTAITSITFIFENSNNTKTSYKNTVKSLKVVRGAQEDNLDTISDVEVRTEGVYKPESFVAPNYPEADVAVYEPETEETSVKSETKAFPTAAVIIAASAVLIIVSATAVTLIVRRKKKKSTDKPLN